MIGVHILGLEFYFILQTAGLKNFFLMIFTTLSYCR